VPRDEHHALRRPRARDRAGGALSRGGAATIAAPFHSDDALGDVTADHPLNRGGSKLTVYLIRALGLLGGAASIEPARTATDDELQAARRRLPRSGATRADWRARPRGTVEGRARHAGRAGRAQHARGGRARGRRDARLRGIGTELNAIALHLAPDAGAQRVAECGAVESRGGAVVLQGGVTAAAGSLWAPETEMEAALEPV
jgi:hypothetical protein